MKVEIIVDGQPFGSPVYVMPGDRITYTAANPLLRVSDTQQQLEDAKKEIARWAASDGGKWQTLLKIAACSSLEEAHKLARGHVGEPYHDEGDDW